MGPNLAFKSRQNSERDQKGPRGRARYSAKIKTAKGLTESCGGGGDATQPPYVISTCIAPNKGSEQPLAGGAADLPLVGDHRSRGQA